MFFKKKSDHCENCNSKIDKKFSFCPYCGDSLMDEERHARDYGLLGKGEEMPEAQDIPMGFGITDKFISSLMNSLVKNLDMEFSNAGKDNRIRIKIGASPKAGPKGIAQKTTFKKSISEKQIEKMSSLPRTAAKTKVIRLNDKIIYELDAPGITSPHDIFVSKLESGYEIKAIGDKKVYVNSLPVNLPLKSISMNNNKLLVEFLMYNR